MTKFSVATPTSPEAMAVTFHYFARAALEKHSAVILD